MTFDMRGAIREVTDEEVAFFQEHGWVKLDKLVAPELIAEMLGVAREIVAEMKSTVEEGNPLGLEIIPKRFGALWESYVSEDWTGNYHPAVSVANGIKREPFLSFVLDKKMARAGYRLNNRSRLTDEIIPVTGGPGTMLCKGGVDQNGGEMSEYHQDWAAGSQDRVGGATFWIALDEVRPDQGAMRFLDGSHREGPLRGSFTKQDLLEIYPKLADIYPLSPPFHYQPGDATVHTPLTVHCAPRNITQEQRWSFICGYDPTDFEDRRGPVEKADHVDKPKHKAAVVYP